jgi:hypothetical protein
MSPGAPGYIEAYDTLTMCLSQVDGVLSALEASYTEQRVRDMSHALSPKSALDTLSAARELLRQATVASEALEPGER